MTDAASTWRQVASVVSQSSRQAVPQLAVGLINRVSVTGSAGEVQVSFGFTPDLIPISSSNWTSSFASQVGSVNVAGRRVLVAFVDTQPVIIDTLGV